MRGKYVVDFFVGFYGSYVPDNFFKDESVYWLYLMKPFNESPWFIGWQLQFQVFP